jgi:ketosteroid isomerase-like protein
MILHDFFDAAAAFDEDALASLMHPDARISEMPLAAFRKGRTMLAEQSYEVHDVLEAGDKIAARATWRGRLAQGAELQAEIATFTEVRDGRIYRHATYDCYLPS